MITASDPNMTRAISTSKKVVASSSDCPRDLILLLETMSRDFECKEPKKSTA